MQEITGLEVAIIGMAVKLPGAADVGMFWDNLANGVESIRQFKDSELLEDGESPELIRDPAYVKANAVLQDKEYFDSALFGYLPGEASHMDPQMRIYHECVWSAIEDAGYNILDNKHKLGLYVGASANINWEIYSASMNQSGKVGLFLREHLSHIRWLASRIAYCFNFQGPAVFLDSACSTSLVAIHQACQGLLLGDCTMAVAGGVSVTNKGKRGYVYAADSINSRDGHCRPFDAAASGTIHSEGAGAVVLKTLKSALRDGDHIWAVIKGTGVSSDGNRKAGYATPSLEGQIAAISMAQKRAKTPAESIGLIEAHGTGTPIGDSIEVEALNRVFGATGGKHCAIGSVKSNIGHTDAAAGVAGVIKAALALKHRQIPPSLHFRTPNPEIDFDGGPFSVAAGLRTWQRNGGPLRAGVNSFAIGGSNAHIVLEEAPERPASADGQDWQLIIFSGKTYPAFQRNKARLVQFLNGENAGKLSDIAYTLQTGRVAFGHRGMIVARDSAEAIRLLTNEQSEGHVAENESPIPWFVVPGRVTGDADGHAIQYSSEPFYQQVTAECFAMVKELTGSDRLPNGVVAFFIREFAVVRMLEDWGVKPAGLIARDIGVLVAVCVAGIISLREALTLLLALSNRASESAGRFSSLQLAGLSLKPGRIPILSLSTGGPVTAPEIASPAFWEACLGGERSLQRAIRLQEENNFIFVETSAKGTLASLLRASGADASAYNIVSLADAAGDNGCQLLVALGQLWVAGITPDWTAFNRSKSGKRISLPGYSFDKTKYPVFVDGIKMLSVPDGAARAGNSASPIAQHALVTPSNEEEQLLAVLWAEILSLDVGKISVTANFFAIGGDSMKAVKLIAILRERLKIRVSIADIFTNPTIRTLANRLRSPELAAKAEDALLLQVEEDLHNNKEKFLASGVIGDNKLIEDVFPASDIQQGMIFHGLAEPGIHHNQMVRFLTDEQWDLSLFEHAFRLMVQKHAILRTAFYQDGKMILQIVFASIPCPVQFHDVSGAGRAEQREAISRFLEGDRAMPFELDKPGLWRLSVFYLGAGQYCTCFIFHHAILDGWSFASLSVELENIMTALKKDREFVPAFLKSSYRDFVCDQLVAGKTLAQSDFWRKELGGNKQFSFNSGDDTPGYKELRAELPPELFRELTGFARKENISIKNICFSAFVYALNLFNFENDITVGIVTDNRPAVADGEKILGCFLNTIPVRMILDRPMTWREFIGQVDQKLSELKRYDKLSLAAISGWVEDKQQGGNPITDIIFNYSDFYIYDAQEMNGKEGGDELKEDFGAFSEMDRTRSNFPFFFSVDATGGELDLGLSYAASYISERDAGLFCTYFQTILSLSLRDAEASINNADILSGCRVEPSAIICGGRQDCPSGGSLMSLFKQQVDRSPDKVAVRYPGGSMLYSELWLKAGKIAGYLRERMGVGTGEMVGVMLEREEFLMPCIFGILSAGAAYVPIDPNFPAKRIKMMLEDSDTRTIFTRGRYLKDDSLLLPGIIDLDRVESEIEGQEPRWFLDQIQDDALAYVIFTSGSTGRPKGVMIDQRSVINRLWWGQQMYPVGEDDVMLQKTSVTFDVSVIELFWWSFTGATLCLLGPGEEKEPGAIMKAIADNKVTNINFVPSMLGVFLTVLARSGGTDRLSSLKRVFCTGEALRPDQVKLFGELLNGPNGTRLINLYGPTEACVEVSGYECSFQERGESIPIGRPIDDIGLYVLDRAGQLMPAGVRGELCISGAGLARGYINNVVLTTKKFGGQIPGNPVRIYRTGDLARLAPEGHIEFFGRMDDQVKIRGFRIELGEIERQLALHKDVSDCAVIVWGSPGDQILVAYVVWKRKAHASDVREYLEEIFPDYMIPTHFVDIDSLPHTNSGKVDKRALPDPVITSPAKEAYEELDEMETELAGIWAAILDMDPGRINKKSHFLQLGGHSLKMIILIEWLRKQFKVVLKFKDIFDRQTLGQQAEFIRICKYLSPVNTSREDNNKIEAVI